MKKDDDVGMKGVRVENDFDTNKPTHSLRQPVRFLFFNIDHWSPLLQMGILSLGVLVFFMMNGFVEEYIFAVLPKFDYGWYLTFYELICFSAFAALERTVIFQEPVFQRNAPIKYHSLVAIAMTLSRGLTNVSLQYLNYPTQVIFKSLKLLTVMVGSTLMLGKTHSLLDYLSSSFLVLSAIFFSLGDREGAPAFNNTGLIIVSLSLVADSIHANSQELVLNTHRASIRETMIFTNLIAAGFSFLYTAVSGELFLALEYCALYPQAYVFFIARSLTIYFGVMCFVTLIKNFNVVFATTVTTVRKILTVFASFFIFPKPFGIKHFYGALLFLGGLAVGVYKSKLKEDEKRAAKFKTTGNV